MDACLLLPILLITKVAGSTLEQEEMEVEEVVQENFISSRDFKVRVMISRIILTRLLSGNSVWSAGILGLFFRHGCCLSAYGLG